MSAASRHLRSEPPQSRVLAEEVTTGPYRAVALLYVSGCLYASAVTTVTGSAHLFSYFHLFFFGAVICLTASKGFLAGLWRPLAQNWSAAFLLLFLFYWLITSLMNSNTEVGLGYAKNVFNRAMPGLLLGYVTFAAYGRNARPAIIRGQARWSPGSLRLVLDCLALAAYFATIYVCFELLSQNLGTTLFLVVNDGPGASVYQIFGNYICLSLICAIQVADPYLRFRFRNSLIAAGVWAGALSAACWLSFLISQMVGSNTGAVLSILIGIYGLVVAWSEFRNGRALRAIAIVLAFAVAIAFAQQALQDLPPMRLFNFNA